MMTETLSLNEAADAMRGAMRDLIRRHWLFYFTQGVLMGLAGLTALVSMVISSSSAIVILGWILIISGLFQGIFLLRVIKVPHFWVTLTSLFLSIVVGLLFITHQEDSLLLLSLLLVIFFVIGGIAKIILGLTIRPFPKWGWIMASGGISILLAAFLWSSTPIAAAWVLGMLVGVQLTSEGLALAYMARWAGRTAPP